MRRKRWQRVRRVMSILVLFFWFNWEWNGARLHCCSSPVWGVFNRRHLKWLELYSHINVHVRMSRSIFSQPLLARTWCNGFFFPRHCEGSDLESSKWFRPINYQSRFVYVGIQLPQSFLLPTKTARHFLFTPKEESISCLTYSTKKTFICRLSSECNLRIATDKKTKSEHTSIPQIPIPPSYTETPDKYYSSFPTPSPNPSTPP